jgi:hypothetical protein
MIFLIEYNRRQGQIVTFKQFKDSAQIKAEKSRLNLEISLNRLGIHHEVVLLQASSERELRKTHRRYFEDYGEIYRSATGSQ